MKKVFLYSCSAFAHRMDTSNPMGHGRSEEFHIKGFTPEIRDMMTDLSKVLEPDQSVFLIRDDNFDYVIRKTYIEPALEENEKQYKGKMVMNAHLFVCSLLLSAIIPMLLFLWLLKDAGLLK